MKRRHGPNLYGSDMEDVPLIQLEEKRPAWDGFDATPRRADSGSMAEAKTLSGAERFMKLCAYIVTFTIVLTSAVISKGTLLFMTSQVSHKDTKLYCNEKLGRNKQFVVTLPDVERVAWIWMIFFAYMTPQAGTFIRSLRKVLFKKWSMPTFMDFLIVFLTETLPTIGTALFVFCILPELDVVKGAMLTNAVCFVPAVLGLITLFQKTTKQNKNKVGEIGGNALTIILHSISIAAQASAFVVWPLVDGRKILWLIPISTFLISIGWWENYSGEDSKIPFLRAYAKKIKDFRNDTYFIYMFLSLWKILVFFSSMVIIFYIDTGKTKYLFNNFEKAFAPHDIYVEEIEPVYIASIANLSSVISIGAGTNIESSYLTPVWVWLINIGCTYICYAFGKFTCKVMIQPFSFAFPINLTMPVVISGLIAMSGAFIRDECSYTRSIPEYLFFDVPPIYYLKDFITQQQSWIWLLWLLSQTWITVHIWTPTCEKLETTERLFVRPMFDPFFIDQDIALNRRIHDKKYLHSNENTILEESEMRESLSTLSTTSSEYVEETFPEDSRTRIYACGTMWHETKEEMMEFLKSIIRLDADYSARKIANERNNTINEFGYYELETHIFFDDAFIRKNENDNSPLLNRYVKDLIDGVSDAASEVHEVNLKVQDPIKYPTPYGGRLVWTLPGKSKMVAHLKDKKKIRAKKRWSQVMYMYYLLGHRLMDTSLNTTQKDMRSENTYILALDGDIDFQPKAVILLIDLMKKNKDLGAACGRIHPVGSGGMVWYQMFEYAVGHWLQKATEHVIGCVLCSPGCFSLFRGKALMDDNVMAKYTTKSTEALHYVQFDQGEDRWLCTLLLQKGFRVEYSAASDAYTHCPEGFNEFYNQRRRWMPSTTANILDLLNDYKHTVKINENISMLYVFYQGILMIGTVLGPGTIFLMLVGAFVAAFQLDQWSSLLWNLIPISIFIAVCKFFKENVQLAVAAFISSMYGLVMIAVLVGVMLQMSSDGLLAPSSLFFFVMAGEFIITALLHPKEFYCLKYGVVYYITVPSMYMLLVIYSVFNMNNVSWGTREVTVVPKVGDQVQVAPKNITMTDRVLSMFSMIAPKTKQESSCNLNIPGMFNCLCCPRDAHSVEGYQLEEIKKSLDEINRRIDLISHGVQEPITISPQRRKTVMLEGSSGKKTEEIVEDDTPNSEIISNNEEMEEDVSAWMDDEDVDKFEVGFLDEKERLFWIGLIDKYLHPIDDSKDKDRILKNLIDLRDKAVAAFFMINSVFVLIVFLLTLKKEEIHIDWPLDVKTNFTYDEISGTITMTKEYLELEPIGFVFLIFFFFLMIIQFIGMLFHRFGTFCQILSNTTLINEEGYDYVAGIKELQSLKPAKRDEEMLAPSRRKTVATIQNNLKTEKKEVKFLEDAVEDNLNMPNLDKSKEGIRRRTTLANLKNFEDKEGRDLSRKSIIKYRQSRFSKVNPRVSKFGQSRPSRIVPPRVSIVEPFKDF